MKIGLYLHKDLIFTHTNGIWGDVLWAYALKRGLERISPENQFYIFGENLGFAPETDIAIYFNFDVMKDFTGFKYHGKKNIVIAQNFRKVKQDTESIFKRYLELPKDIKIATISKYYADKYGWKLLYPAVDMDLFKPVPSVKEYECDVAYIGNNIKELNKTQKYLSAQNIKYGIYGKGFNRPVGHKESLKIFCSALSNLNYGFDPELEIITARIFQIAACKGLIISEGLPVYKEIFEDNMLWVEPDKDIGFQIQTHVNWLKRNEKAAQKMKENCFEIVKEKYSCEAQAKILWEWINENSI